jgi:hypothetical protein
MNVTKKGNSGTVSFFGESEEERKCVSRINDASPDRREEKLDVSIA